MNNNAFARLNRIYAFTLPCFFLCLMTTTRICEATLAYQTRKHDKMVRVSTLKEILEEDYRKEPSDYEVLYGLARMNMFLYHQEDTLVPVFKPSDQNTKATWLTTVSLMIRPSNPKNKNTQTLQYLDNAIKFFDKASKIPPTKRNNRSAVYLGLAWVLEESLFYRESISIPGAGDIRTAEEWRKYTVSVYRKVVTLSSEKDLKSPGYLGDPNTLLAIQGIVRLQSERKLTHKERLDLQHLKRIEKFINTKPRYIS